MCALLLLGIAETVINTSCWPDTVLMKSHCLNRQECSCRCKMIAIGQIVALLPTPSCLRQSQGLDLLQHLSVFLFFHVISQKTDAARITKWYTNIPPRVVETHVFWGQMSRSRGTIKRCQHGFQCECWLLLDRHYFWVFGFSISIIIFLLKISVVYLQKEAVSIDTAHYWDECLHDVVNENFNSQWKPSHYGYYYGIPFQAKPLLQKVVLAVIFLDFFLISLFTMILLWW